MKIIIFYNKKKKKKKKENYTFTLYLCYSIILIVDITFANKANHLSRKHFPLVN